jgi:hypothetical protein
MLFFAIKMSLLCHGMMIADNASACDQHGTESQQSAVVSSPVEPADTRRVTLGRTDRTVAAG